MWGWEHCGWASPTVRPPLTLSFTILIKQYTKLGFLFYKSLLFWLHTYFHSHPPKIILDHPVFFQQLQRMIPKKMETITEHLILPNFI